MNAQELRIGNWVQISKPEQVCDVMCDSISSERKIYFLEEIEPIPLTEEWLLKFGFKQSYDGYFNLIVNNLFTISWNVHERKLILNGLFLEPNDCVHQLQNLYFALTGKELEIK